MTTAYDFEAKALDGTPLKLSEYTGKVLLIVKIVLPVASAISC